MTQPTRRTFIRRTGATLLGLSLFGPSRAQTSPATTGTPSTPRAPVTTPAGALARLAEGNRRFQAGQLTHPDQTLERRRQVATKQQPYAMIFACADSRESPELIFDEGLGDLFVIRTAGHVLDQAALGSLEYGVAELKIPLLVVLGHQRCGAVGATIEAVDKREIAPGSIEALVDGIRPAVLLARGEGAARLDSAVRANVAVTLQRLENSKILSEAMQAGRLRIEGGRYDLDNGTVEFGVGRRG